MYKISYRYKNYTFGLKYLGVIWTDYMLHYIRYLKATDWTFVLYHCGCHCMEEVHRIFRIFLIIWPWHYIYVVYPILRTNHRLGSRPMVVLVNNDNRFSYSCGRLKKPEVSEKQGNVMSATWILSAAVLLAMTPQQTHSQGNLELCRHRPALFMFASIYIVSQKTRQLWNGIAQNYNIIFVLNCITGSCENYASHCSEHSQLHQQPVDAVVRPTFIWKLSHKLPGAFGEGAFSNLEI